GLAGRDLELDQPSNLLLLGGHRENPLQVPGRVRPGFGRPLSGPGQILETCVQFNSTGVSRPKMDTRNFSFCCSALTSLMLAGSVATAPSVSVADSPTSRSTSMTGAATPSTVA